MAKISVIIPAYNSEKTILETIKSVLGQTFIDFEIIIVDDGSTDATLTSISQFNDERIKVFTQRHQGANVCRNFGLSCANGEFVSFLDADDVWTHNKLSSQLKALQENLQASVAYSWTDYIDENGNFLLSGTHITANGRVYEKLLVSNFLENGSNPLIRKSAIIELGGFDEKLNAAQDWDMWLRLSNKFEFVAVPKVQILYRKSRNSLSSNLHRQEKSSLQVLEKAYRLSDRDVQHLRSQSLTNLYKYLTCKSLEQPYTRNKAMFAAKFLWRLCIYDFERFYHWRLYSILCIKILLIILYPSYPSLLIFIKCNFQSFMDKPMGVKQEIAHINNSRFKNFR
ncbi:glycosyltransferase [Calothrix sp. 336/3]|uniref:glycosyltransferase n=1 Tax=Calothrix sp. 336/3 TaxID=1337936 RepID=UPI0009E2318C|nr:glycosyltransferase [Calothrix sp. 336/3]